MSYSGYRIYLDPVETPLVVKHPKCPDAAGHTPSPQGYLHDVEWAQEMLKTHVQLQCAGCELWVIWRPR